MVGNKRERERERKGEAVRIEKPGLVSEAYSVLAWIVVGIVGAGE